MPRTITKETARWLFDLILVSLLVATLSVVGVHQAAVYFKYDSAYVSAVSAFASFATAAFGSVTALAAAVYVVLTHRLWRETADQAVVQRQGSEMEAMKALMVEYDNLRDSVKTIVDFFLHHPTTEHALNAFRNARVAPHQENTIMLSIDPARFRISRFFVKNRKLAMSGYLERRLIMIALGREAIEDVFLGMVDRLDQVISVIEHGRENVTDTNFYRNLVDDFHAHQL